MADDKLYVVKESELKAVANTLRSKAGSSTPVTWFTGFTSGIDGILVDTASDAELWKLYKGETTAVTIKTGITSIKSYRFYNFSSLSYVNFNQVTNIPEYTCYSCSNLSQVVLAENTTNIGSYAFSNCANATFELPKTIESFGYQSCYYCGANKNVSTFGFDNKSEIITNFSGYAFCNSGLQYLIGKLGSIESCAFNNCTKLNQINITTATFTGNSIFQDCYNVQNTPENPTKINCVWNNAGSYSFYNFAKNRADNNYIQITINEGTSTTIGDYCFASNSSSIKNKYLEIYLPASITTINSYAFRYNDHLLLHVNSAPDLASTYVFQGCTNSIVLFEDIDVFQQTMSKNYWPSLTSVTLACGCLGKKYGLGAELPPYTKSGYKLTWYTDLSYTTEITQVVDESSMYYCKITGAVREAAWIKVINTVDCSIIVEDVNTGKTFKQGDYVLLNSTLRITASPNISSWLLALLKVNKDIIQNGSTISVTDDIKITAVFTEDGQMTGWCFGVSGISQSATTLTRTQDSSDFNWSFNSDTGVWEGDFNDYLNFERITDEFGNVFVRIPTLYRNWDGGDELCIASYQVNNSFLPYPVFIAEDGSINEYVDIGVYRSSVLKSKVYSKTQTDVGSSYMSTFRNYLPSSNSFIYFMRDLRVTVMLWDLFMVVFAERDATKIIAENYSSGKTGQTDSLLINTLEFPTSICAKTTTGSDTYKVFKFFGIEGLLWGDGEIIDGIRIYTDNWYYCENPIDYADSSKYSLINYKIFANNCEWWKNLGYISEYPFANLPVNTSSQVKKTYYHGFIWNPSNGARNGGTYKIGVMAPQYGGECKNFFSIMYMDTYSSAPSRLCRQPR